MEINDLIFKELVKQGYAVEGNSRIWNLSDSKLSYLIPEQAETYLNFQDITKYKSKLSNKELNLINSRIDELVDIFKGTPLNIIDLGCGDGKKVIPLLEAVNKVTKVRYCPIDISGHMVNKAINFVKRRGIGDVIEFQYNISDFDNLENILSLLSNGEYKRNLFLLLGNTLGNFEMHEILHKIRNVMRGGDYLLIGNGINNDKVDQEIIEFCKSSKEHTKFSKLVPMQLGFDDDELEYMPRFEHSRLEFINKVLVDKEIKLNGKEIKLKKGDLILSAFCYYLRKDEFKSLMNLYFSEARIFTTEDNSYVLAVCKK